MSHNGTSDSSSYLDENWASWFCNLSGNQFFCEIEKSYIEDSFNLFGLKQYISKDYSKALDTILDRLTPTEPETEDLSRSAALLYGLIHARYIVTSHGLDSMHRKYTNKEFGECPRVLCRGQPVVPMGFADDPKHGMVKLFCPKCRDVYNCHANHRHIDGAFFGPTFPNLFFMSYENLVPEPAVEQFVPRVFGFRIHHTSNSIPRVDRVGVSSSNNSSGSSANSTMPQMLPHRNSTTPSEMEVHGNLVDLSGTLKTGSKDTSAGNQVAQGNYTKKSSNIEITGLGSRATQRSSNSIASNSQVICTSLDKQGGDTAVPFEQTGSDLLKYNKFATADNKIAAASSSLDNSKDNKPEHNTNEKRSMRKRTAQAHEQEEERKSTNSLKTGTNNISANGPSKKTRAT